MKFFKNNPYLHENMVMNLTSLSIFSIFLRSFDKANRKKIDVLYFQAHWHGIDEKSSECGRKSSWLPDANE